MKMCLWFCLCVVSVEAQTTLTISNYTGYNLSWSLDYANVCGGDNGFGATGNAASGGAWISHSYAGNLNSYVWIVPTSFYDNGAGTYRTNVYAIWLGGCQSNYSGYTGGGGMFCEILSDYGAPTSGLFTNQGCVEVANTGSVPVYYQWGVYGSGSPQYLDGCSAMLTFNGVGGPGGDGNEWFAVYPGASWTVCVSVVTNVATRYALVAFVCPVNGAGPCGLNLGQPLCVDLCSDGQQLLGASGGLMVASNLLSQSSAPSISSGTNLGSSGSTNAEWSGTNGIGWPSNPGTNLMLDSTGRTGFAALNNDLGVMNQNLIAGFANVVAAVNSNRTVIATNGLASTNWPTNYPDALADQALGLMYSNMLIAPGSSNQGLLYNAIVGNASNVAASSGIGPLLSNQGAQLLSLIPPTNAFGAGILSTGIVLGKFCSGAPAILSIGMGDVGGQVSGVLNVLNGILVCLIALFVFKFLVDVTFETFREVMSQRQLREPPVKVAGTDILGVPLGFALGIFVTALVITIPTLYVGFIGAADAYDTASGLSSSAAPLAVTVAWGYFVSWFPVGAFLTGASTCVLWKYVVCRPAEGVGRLIIMNLISG